MMKNSEKNAALERRLRAEDVPTPPVHLRDRLKSQIPASFTYPSRGKRPSWQSAWAIAASLFLLVNVTYFGLRFLTGDIPASGDRTAARQAPPRVAEVAQGAPEPPAASNQVMEREELISQGNLSASPDLSKPTAADAFSETDLSPSRKLKDSTRREREASAKKQDKEEEDPLEKIAVDDSVRLGSATESRDTMARAQEPERKNDIRTDAQRSKAALAVEGSMAPAKRVAESVTIMTAPALPPATPPAAVPQPAPSQESFPNHHGTAFVDTLVRGRSSFGLHPGGGSYVEARRLLAQRRMPRSIETEEFVNHFRYGDAVPDKEDFSLRGQGSVVRLLAEGRERVFVRFGIQARQSRPEDGGAIVARNARVEVLFNPGAVSRFRRLGYDDASDRREGTTIESGHAVSAVYEIELRPGAPSASAAARMVLTYEDSRGESRNVTTSLRQGDISSSWSQATVPLKVSVMAATIAEGMRERDRLKLEVARSLVQELAEKAPESDAGELLEFLELLRRVMPF